MKEWQLQVAEVFEFPAQRSQPPPAEYAAPATGPQAEFDSPLAAARAGVPAYQRGPSYAREVDNLAEPQVLRKDTTVEETVLVSTCQLMAIPTEGYATLQLHIYACMPCWVHRCIFAASREQSPFLAPIPGSGPKLQLGSSADEVLEAAYSMHFIHNLGLAYSKGNTDHSACLMQTPVAEGRYKRQRVTSNFTGETGGKPPAARIAPPKAAARPTR